MAKRCADSPELLKRVLRLVEAERLSDGFLEDAPRVDAVDLDLDDRSGQRMGAFELIEILAIGGMSTVYRARRVDGTYDQEVAVKLFGGASLDAEGRRRFEAERRIVAALEHPGIARIIDGGTAEDGTPYVVMELVRGEPITRYCRHNRIGVDGRLQLLQQVCEALEIAHRRGIVHRDIKSGNVLVTDDGLPKLIDFGIARILDPAALPVDMPETRLGGQLMTPEYASPEQLRGEPVGIASDIYSLGVLAYELLTGVRPHPLSGMSPAEMERTVCGTVAVDPSGMVKRRRGAPSAGLGNARSLRRRLRGDIDRIVMTAMRTEAQQRYPTAQALADDIERHLTGKPVHARGASRLYRTGKFITRYRTGVGAVAVIFVAMAVALIAVEQQRERALVEAQRAESAKQFLTEMIQRADPFENAAEPTLAGALRQAIPGLAERFAGQPRLEGDLRYAIGFALQNLGEIGPARAQLERALELRINVGSSVDIAEVYDGLGILAWWESDFERGREHFGRALELLEGRDEERAALLRVNVLANDAAMMIDAGDNEASERLALRALDAAEDIESVETETLAAIWSSVATARDGLGRSNEALDAFERALEFQREATGEMHPSYAIVLNNLALMYHGMDRLEDATEAMQRSVEIRRATLGESHPQTATALFNLARLQTIAGALTPAEQNARMALEVAQNGYPAGHPRIGKAHEALAIVLNARGSQDEALKQARLARTLYQQAAGVDPAWIAAVDTLIESMGATEVAQSSPE